MVWRRMGIFCLVLWMGACGPVPLEGTGGAGGGESVEPAGGSGGGVPIELPDPSGDPGAEKDQEDVGFDPCPPVTYVLWEADGIIYEVTIDVFCDPMQDIYLGCPAPF